MMTVPLQYVLNRNALNQVSMEEFSNLMLLDLRLTAAMRLELFLHLLLAVAVAAVAAEVLEESLARH